MSDKLLSEELADKCRIPEISPPTEQGVTRFHDIIDIETAQSTDKNAKQGEPSKKTNLSKRNLTDKYTDDDEDQDEKLVKSPRRSQLQTEAATAASYIQREAKLIPVILGSNTLPGENLHSKKSDTEHTGLSQSSNTYHPTYQTQSNRLYYEQLLRFSELFKADEDGDTILHIAIVHNKVNLTENIIDAMVRRKHECRQNGLDIQNNLKQAALHLAVLTCQPRIVEYLVENGADVNLTDRNGQTALHLACKNADLEDVRALKQGVEKWHRKFGNKDKSIDLNSRNFEGFAPIHLATFIGSCEVLEDLLKTGADINAKDSTSGRTALHHAVEAYNPIVTRFLLTHNADVNAQTFAGNTPLHTAGGRHMESIINVLMRFGADVTITNSEGDPALLETNKFYSLHVRLRTRSRKTMEK